MKVVISIMIAFIFSTGCAIQIKKLDSYDEASNTVIKPTPTPMPLMEDHNRLWRNSTDLSVPLESKALWQRLSNPEKWSAFSSKVTEANMVGAELREGTSFSWKFNADSVLSEVTVCDAEKKIIFKGTPYAADAEIEFSMRHMDDAHCLLHFECRLLPGWNKKQKDKQATFFREFAAELQGIK